MSYDYSNKIVAVTGGCGNLGSAVVDAYFAAGARVVVGDRSTFQGSSERTNPAFFQVNFQNELDVKNFFGDINSYFGAPDVLINVIGGYKAGSPVSDTSLEDFQEQLDLNLKSAFLITKHAIKEMEQKGGSIVHVSSRAALDKGKNAFSYSVSKLGVIRLVEAASEEVKNKNININAILPSIINTPANRLAMPNAATANWPSPLQISKVLLFLTSPDAELISGAAIPVYGKA